MKATAWNVASAGSSVPSCASVSVDLPASVVSSNRVSQLVRVSGIAGSCGPPASASSAWSTMSIYRLAPRGGSETQTTPRRTDRVPGARVCVRPGSARAVGRGRRLAKRESVSVMAVSQVSVCSASSAGSTSDSNEAGRRFKRVPGDPLAIRLSVVSSSLLRRSGATPGSSRPALRRSRCWGAACSTPSLNSTRNRLTAPRSMNQTLSGSSRFTGRLPAQGTDVPERAASSEIDV